MSIKKSVLLLLVFHCLVGCGGKSDATATPQPQPTTAAPSPAANEIVLTTGEYPPYTSENLAGYGAMTEIVSAAFVEMGLTPKYLFYPWKRAEDEARQGRAFAAFPYKQTADRSQEFDFSDPLYVVNAQFFYNRQTHPDGIAFTELADLQGYVIGGLLGSWYEELFQQAGLNVEYASDLEMNFKKLHQGRVDLVVEEENACWAAIKQLYPDEVDQFAVLEKPLDQNELRLMVSRQYPQAAELLEQFNAALQSVRDKGIYQQILQKYDLVE